MDLIQWFTATGQHTFTVPCLSVNVYQEQTPSISWRRDIEFSTVFASYSKHTVDAHIHRTNDVCSVRHLVHQLPWSSNGWPVNVISATQIWFFSLEENTMTVGFIEGLLRMDTTCTLEDWVPSSTVVLFLFSCIQVFSTFCYSDFFDLSPCRSSFRSFKALRSFLRSFSLGLGSTLQWDHSRQSFSLQAQQLKEGHL